MILKELAIKNKDSLEYAHATFYGQEYSEALMVKERPVVLISPGGGYAYTSDRESEIIALQFLAKGYHAVVVRYSCHPAVYPTALLEFAAAVKEVRTHAAEWHVDTERLFVLGFSAGAHLVASFCSFWEKPFLSDALGCDKELLRPNGQVLCYPVITSGEFANKGTIEHLLGKEPSEGMLEYVSSEKQVDKNTPPCFIWHTFEDEIVPVENSLFFAAALRKAGVPFDLHIYEKGIHGLALAGERYKSVEGMAEAEYHPWTHDLLYWLKARGIIKE